MNVAWKYLWSKRGAFAANGRYLSLLGLALAGFWPLGIALSTANFAHVLFVVAALGLAACVKIRRMEMKTQFIPVRVKRR